MKAAMTRSERDVLILKRAASLRGGHDCKKALRWSKKLRCYVCAMCGAEDR